MQNTPRLQLSTFRFTFLAIAIAGILYLFNNSANSDAKPNAEEPTANIAASQLSAAPTLTASTLTASPANPTTPSLTAPLTGVVGDGVHDDTAAIQKAVDSSSGEIRFPRGIYKLTKPVVINLDKVGPTSLVADGPARIVMAGAGPAFHFIGTHDGTAAPHTVKPNVWKNQRTPMVDGLEIVGAHPEACGIEATGTMQMTFTRVTVRKALHGIHFTTRNRNFIISDCQIYHNRGVGIYYDHVNIHQSNIIGSHISYNAGGGIVISGGNVRNVHIGTCDIEGNMGDEKSQPTANILLDSTGGENGPQGSIGEVAIVGCTIQHTHKAPNSANIRVNGDSTPRPKITTENRHGHITIADNVLSDVQVNIDLINTRSATITGNTIWKGFTHNLKVKNSTQIVVGNNLFDHNPRYDRGKNKTSKLGLVFIDSDSCILNGNQIHGVHLAPAALTLKNCSRFNITNCTVLDSPVGISLENVTNSRISDCIIRDDRPEKNVSVSLRIKGGKNIMLRDNMIGDKKEIDPKEVNEK